MGGAVPLRVFISYARQDTAFVDQLEKHLRDRGYDTWVDRNATVGGDTWMHAIQAGIDGAQVVIVALSPEAADSMWVESEYAYALNQRKRIIPLMYRPCNVPLALQRLNWIDFVSSFNGGLEQLLHTLTVIEGEERRRLAEQRAAAEAALQAQAEMDARIRVATDTMIQQQIDAIASQRIAEALEQRQREEAAARAQLEREHAEALQRAQEEQRRALEEKQRAQEAANALQREREEQQRVQQEQQRALEEQRRADEEQQHERKEVERKRVAAQEVAKLKLFRVSGGIGAVCLLWGLGATLVFYLHSWQVACGAAALAAVVSYLLRYRLTVPLFGMIGLSALGVASVYALSIFLPSLHYDQAQIAHLWLVGDRSIWLGRQLNSAIGFGLLAGFAWSAALDEGSSTNTGTFPSSVAYFFWMALVAFIGCEFWWLIIAAPAAVFGWGFGFGVGWNLAVFLWLPSASALSFGCMELVYALLFRPLRNRGGASVSVQTSPGDAESRD